MWNLPSESVDATNKLKYKVVIVQNKPLFHMTRKENPNLKKERRK